MTVPDAPEEFDFVNGREAWQEGYRAALAATEAPAATGTECPTCSSPFSHDHCVECGAKDAMPWMHVLTCSHYRPATAFDTPAAQAFLAATVSPSPAPLSEQHTSSCHDEHCIRVHAHEPPHTDGVHVWGDENACPPAAPEESPAPCPKCAARETKIERLEGQLIALDRATPEEPRA